MFTEAEPTEDEEPALGSFNRHFDQRVSWDVSRSSMFDAERDDCDDEDELGGAV